MSWPGWSTAPAPAGMPAAMAPPVQSSIMPAAINSAPSVIPPGLQYSPEQWAQAQQQNWQQWAQWQQQYQQWHQQYGAEYQKSMSAIQNTMTVPQPQPPLPSMPNTGVPPPLPAESKPPLPPEEPPANQPAMPSYATAPMKPAQQAGGYSTAPPPQMAAQQPPPQPPPQQQQQPYDPYASQRQNWQHSQVNTNNKRPYGHGPDYDNTAKRPLMDNRNQWGNQGRQGHWQNQQPQGQHNANYHQQPPPQAAAKPGPNIEELSEAEKKFDKEFAAWEAQFNKWKDQNANHPDKTQYLEYEKKWESWRNSLLERREQMRRKRLAMVAAAGGTKPAYGHAPQTPAQSDMGRAPPLIAQPPASHQPHAQHHHRPAPVEPQAPKPEELIAKPPPHQNNEPLAFKPPSGSAFPGEEQPENSGDGFLKSSTTSGGGIPGLDLVKEDEPKDADKENVDIDKEEKTDAKAQEPPPPKGPDLDAISKGINTILGDQKLLSMLSIVSQNPPSAPPPNVATDTISNMPPAGHNFNAPPPPPPQQHGEGYGIPPPGGQVYNDHSNHSLEDRSSFGDNFQQRESVNNFDDQTRSSFTMGPMDQDPSFQGNNYLRGQGGKFPPSNRFGPEPGRGGFGTEPSRGGFGTEPSRGGFGPEPGRGNFGQEPSRGGFGPEPNRGGFGSQPSRGGFGTEPSRGGFGTEPSRGGFGTEPSRGGFGTEPSRGGFGPEPGRGNFGSGLLDNKSKFGPGANRGSDFGPPGPGNFQQEGGNLNQGPSARRPDNRGKNFDGRNDYQNDKPSAQDNMNRFGSNFRGGFDRMSNLDRGNGNANRANSSFDRGNGGFDRGPGNFDRGRDGFDNDRRGNFGKSDNFNQKIKYDKYGAPINPVGYDDYDNYEEEDDDYEKYHEMFNDDEDQDMPYQNSPAPRMMNQSGPPSRSMDQGKRMNQGPKMRGMDHGPSMRGPNQGPAARNLDQGPPRGMDQGPPGRGMDQGPPHRGMDQGPPMRGFDQGPPGRGLDHGPPMRGMDQGPPGRGMDQGPPMRGMDQGPPGRGMDQGPPMRGMDQDPMMRDMDQGPPPPLINEVPPVEVPIVPVETDDIFEPATVVDYEHKSQRVPEPEVVIEPIHMFDYRHKPLNRIPVPQRPAWLTEAVKFIREFDPLLPRPVMNFERAPPERYPLNKHRPDWGEPEVPEDRYRPYGREYNDERNGRFTEDFDRNDRRSFGRDEPRFDKPDGGDRGRRSFSRENDRFDRKRGEEQSRFDSGRPGRGNDFEELSDEDMNDFETDELKKHRMERSRSRSRSPMLSNPPNPAQISEITMMEDILNPPGRFNRPPRIVIILRGPPGSGKTYLAKIIKDKEVENGGSAPRILSLDDYFMVEHEKEVVEDGKVVKMKEMVYEFEAEMEESYRTSFVKFFKKTITDGYFPFIIVDNVNDKVKYFGEMWSYAKQNGFQVYICQMDLDPVLCTKRNVHNRTETEIEECIAGWEPTPAHHPTIDASGLLQACSISEVEMEEVEQPQQQQQKEEEKKPEAGPEDEVRSKWDTFDCSSNNLAKLDGVSKPLRPSRTMEEYLQLEDDWKESKPSKPGQKRVRWADLEEQRQQKKMRAIGFVVGHTDWDRMMDPTDGGSALTQTKYFERGGRY